MTDVIVEAGDKKVFASVVDWPGWCRGGPSPAAALEALAAYRPRYEPVAALAGLSLPAGDLVVAERVPGNASTDYGVPGVAAAPDSVPLDAEGATRQAALVSAAWEYLDGVVGAAPAQLTKGPRGGGRDRDKMYQHVLSAEASGYAGKMGLKIDRGEPQVGDRDAIQAAREALLGVLGAPSDGGPLREKGWTSRYAARRIAWHALDHAWEMQDRTPTA